jgi:hypothetical protein
MGHATETRYAGENQSGAYEGRQRMKGRECFETKDCAEKHKAASNNLHLPHDVDRLTSIERDGEAGFLPGIKAAFESVDLAILRDGCESCGISLRASARAAMEYQDIVTGADRSAVIDAAQGVMTGSRNVLTGMLVGLTDIDEDSAFAHKLGRTGGRNRTDVGHFLFSFGFILIATGSRWP